MTFLTQHVSFFRSSQHYSELAASAEHWWEHMSDVAPGDRQNPKRGGGVNGYVVRKTETCCVFRKNETCCESKVSSK